MTRDDVKVSAVVMTLNAEKYIDDFLTKLLEQTLPPYEILVVDSESPDSTIKIAKKYPKTKILTIKRQDFDHGGSRDYAFQNTVGDYVLFFSQDAEISSKEYIFNLVSNFKDPSIAMAYGRQIAKKNAKPYEKLIREFNYPKNKVIKTADDVEKLGIKCFYMSDVCSAYKREIYFKLNGFERNILTNEDMLIATKAIFSGYKVVYEPEASVYHSHNYSFMQEFRRNFDVSCFMRMHESYYSKVNLNSEGKKLVIFVIKGLVKNKNILAVFNFIYICMAKFLGNKFGKYYMHYPKNIILFMSQNKSFWINRWNKR